MRHVMFGISMAVILFLVLAVNFVISGRFVRQNELEQSLDAAVRQVVEELSHQEEQPENLEEFLSDFLESFFVRIKSDSDFIISIDAANPQKGILSVKVEEEFFHINGKKGKIATEKNVILEQYKLEEKQVFQIVFMIGEYQYKNYQLTQETHLLTPQKPGENFLYWADEDGNEMENITELTADRNRIFTAVMKP